MKKLLVLFIVFTMTSVSTFAGGILTNTNQSVLFLKNPARDAAIGLDGVYSNPAGVAFMPEGLHIAFNWQYAHQTRTITSTNPAFALGKKNGGNMTKEYEGVADAPIIPSLQVAYNKGNWSWQLNLSVPGGGGSCEFDNGLASFESVVGNIASSFMLLDGMAAQLNSATQTLSPLYSMFGKTAPATVPAYGTIGYDMSSYMEGRQYYFGIQLGTAYKINENLSVYGGLRLLYGSATYKAKISNIGVNTSTGLVDFADFLPKVPVQVAALSDAAQKHQDLLETAKEAGITSPEMEATLAAIKAGREALEGSQKELSSLSKYSEGVNLLCNQTSLGIAPIIGVDWRYRNFNFAAKYEFKTQIRMKNESTVNEASEIAAVNKYRDGEKVNEDQPALLTIGAQWKPINQVSLNLGWHHYFDKQASWYNNSQEKLSCNSNEYLAGVEWDVTDKLNVSLGGQLTRYGNTDEYINDISFVVNSYSVGFGFAYKVKENITLSAAYFQTMYDDYHRNNYPTQGVNDTFTRTNRVLGLGCQLDL